MIEPKDYNFVVKIKYENHSPHYYNSGNFILVSDINDASRYLTKEVAEKDIDYASSQGGIGSIVKFDEEQKLINSETYDPNKDLFVKEIKYLTCTDCDGSGYGSVFSDIISDPSCKTCHGSGKQECPMCLGTGNDYESGAHGRSCGFIDCNDGYLIDRTDD